MMEPRIPAIPPELLEAMEGAGSAISGLSGELSDIPFGQIAAAGVDGFLSGLPRGWKLISPQGDAVYAADVAEHVRIWSQHLLAPEEPI